MTSKLKQIQSDIEAKLETFFTGYGVEVMSRLRGHITNNIAAKIAAKKIVVMCFPPSIGGIKPNVLSTLHAQECIMQIRVVENPKMNNAGIDAYECVERILSINAHKTSDGTLVSVATVESADPDNLSMVEFVIELKMQINFPRIA